MDQLIRQLTEIVAKPNWQKDSALFQTAVTLGREIMEWVAEHSAGSMANKIGAVRAMADLLPPAFWKVVGAAGPALVKTDKLSPFAQGIFEILIEGGAIGAARGLSAAGDGSTAKGEFLSRLNRAEQAQVFMDTKGLYHVFAMSSGALLVPCEIARMDRDLWEHLHPARQQQRQQAQGQQNQAAAYPGRPVTLQEAVATKGRPCLCSQHLGAGVVQTPAAKSLFARLTDDRRRILVEILGRVLGSDEGGDDRIVQDNLLKADIDALNMALDSYTVREQITNPDGTTAEVAMPSERTIQHVLGVLGLTGGERLPWTARLADAGESGLRRLIKALRSGKAKGAIWVLLTFLVLWITWAVYSAVMTVDALLQGDKGLALRFGASLVLAFLIGGGVAHTIAAGPKAIERWLQRQAGDRRGVLLDLAFDLTALGAIWAIFGGVIGWLAGQPGTAAEKAVDVALALAVVSRVIAFRWSLLTWLREQAQSTVKWLAWGMAAFLVGAVALAIGTRLGVKELAQDVVEESTDEKIVRFSAQSADVCRAALTKQCGPVADTVGYQVCELEFREELLPHLPKAAADSAMPICDFVAQAKSQKNNDATPAAAGETQSTNTTDRDGVDYHHPAEARGQVVFFPRTWFAWVFPTWMTLGWVIALAVALFAAVVVILSVERRGWRYLAHGGAFVVVIAAVLVFLASVGETVDWHAQRNAYEAAAEQAEAKEAQAATDSAAPAESQKKTETQSKPATVTPAGNPWDNNPAGTETEQSEPAARTKWQEPGSGYMLSEHDRCVLLNKRNPAICD